MVRLTQGSAAKETVYSHDPVAQAQAFVADGASWLHVVDLDRAFGDGDNLRVMASLVAALGPEVSVQAGGGFRTLVTIGAAIEAGMARVVIGTAAVRTPELLVEAVAAVGANRLAVGLDARAGMVAVRGWTERTGVRVEEAARRAIDARIRTIVYTDIERDGMLTGPDLEGCQALIGLGAQVIASGGFATVEHVIAARDAGCAGAILGRSLYEKTMTFPDALAATLSTT
ncbi:MAG: 1-(5-phosphoribosyl)-5-((5-phosphoribosylamino)methylideneamino) imidazole-4-carboxamide isomerase [Gemmatimonadetes bacterium]|nr:1-(5-phosphoribosyl)-5-((5-phosphoribosylamino)methylideneamino) imidazole-4-carboxamide isomerase [Gemmatimonadota bacterium]